MMMMTIDDWWMIDDDLWRLMTIDDWRWLWLTIDDDSSSSRRRVMTLVSHKTAYSSAECSRDKPSFSFVRGQDSTMWDDDWWLMMMTTIDDDDDDDTVIEISSGRCVDGSGKAADESLSQAVEPRYSRSRQRRSPTCRGRSVCMVVLLYYHVLLLPCQIFTHWRRKLWGTGARAPPPSHWSLHLYTNWAITIYV